MTALTARQEEVQALALKYRSLVGHTHPRTISDICDRIQSLLFSEVNRIAIEFANCNNPAEDLMQTGRLAVSKALLYYEAKGGSFWTVANYRILGSVKNECRNNNGMIRIPNDKYERLSSRNSPSQCDCGSGGEVNSQLEVSDDGLCDYCKNRKLMPEQVDYDDIHDLSQAISDTNRAEQGLSIQELLYDLAPEDKSLFLRHSVDQETVREIAYSLGVDKMVIQRRLVSIKTFIRDKAEEMGLTSDLLLSV